MANKINSFTSSHRFELQETLPNFSKHSQTSWSIDHSPKANSNIIVVGYLPDIVSSLQEFHSNFFGTIFESKFFFETIFDPDNRVSIQWSSRKTYSCTSSKSSLAAPVRGHRANENANRWRTLAGIALKYAPLAIRPSNTFLWLLPRSIGPRNQSRRASSFSDLSGLFFLPFLCFLRYSPMVYIAIHLFPIENSFSGILCVSGQF